MSESQEQRVDALFDRPLEEFVAARNALAKELSKEGEKALAAQVKALAKPSISAFALNQLVRQHRPAVEAFLKVSDRLARAQLRGLSGGGQDADFKKASGEQRAALDELCSLAAPILERAGHSANRNFLDRIARTLRAIVLDEKQRELFERGRLSADLEDQGFDALAASLGVIDPHEPEREPEPEREREPELVKAPPPPPPKKPKDRTSLTQAKAEEAEARRVLRDAEKEFNKARDGVESLRPELLAAEKAVTEAKRTLIGAEQILDERKARAVHRQKALEVAEAAAGEAREAVIRASKSVESAQAALDDDD